TDYKGQRVAATMQARPMYTGGNLRQMVALKPNTTYTLSFHVKKINHANVGLRIGNSVSTASGQPIPFVNLDNHAKTVPSGIANASLSVSDVGNGWKKIALTHKTGAQPGDSVILSLVSPTGQHAFHSSTGTEKIQIAHAELIEGAASNDNVPAPQPQPQ